MIQAKNGSSQEFHDYIGGRDFPPGWCIRDPEGLAIFDDDRLVAVAIITDDMFGRTWIWFSQKIPLPAMFLHRRANAFLNELRKSGRIVHAFVDKDEPGAENWFRHLGFEPAGVTIHPTGSERVVWLRK